jgi:hypothetical protein
MDAQFVCFTGRILGAAMLRKQKLYFIKFQLLDSGSGKEFHVLKSSIFLLLVNVRYVYGRNYAQINDPDKGNYL